MDTYDIALRAPPLFNIFILNAPSSPCINLLPMIAGHKPHYPIVSGSVSTLFVSYPMHYPADYARHYTIEKPDEVAFGEKLLSFSQ